MNLGTLSLFGATDVRPRKTASLLLSGVALLKGCLPGNWADWIDVGTNGGSAKHNCLVEEGKFYVYWWMAQGSQGSTSWKGVRSSPLAGLTYGSQ